MLNFDVKHYLCDYLSLEDIYNLIEISSDFEIILKSKVQKMTKLEKLQLFINEPEFANQIISFKQLTKNILSPVTTSDLNMFVNSDVFLNGYPEEFDFETIFDLENLIYSKIKYIFKNTPELVQKTHLSVFKSRHFLPDLIMWKYYNDDVYFIVTDNISMLHNEFYEHIMAVTQ